MGVLSKPTAADFGLLLNPGSDRALALYPSVLLFVRTGNKTRRNHGQRYAVRPFSFSLLQLAFCFGFAVSYLLAIRRSKGRLADAKVEAAGNRESARKDAIHERDQYVEDAKSKIQAKRDALEKERQSLLRIARRARVQGRTTPQTH